MRAWYTAALAAGILSGIAATAVGATGSSSVAIRSEQARGAEAIMDLLEQKERGLQRRAATLRLGKRICALPRPR